jgi:hypothetical protein
MACNPTIQAAADLMALAESTSGIPGAWLSVNGLWCFLPAEADHCDVEQMRRALHRVQLDRMGDAARYDRLAS